jgi:hypothetical protein
MGWLTRLRKAPGVAARLGEMASGGGPARLRIRGVSRPTGLLFPVSRLRLEVEARDGSRARWEPPIPLPFPYAWAYRVARWMRVPVVASLDPESLSFSVRIPRASPRR